MEDAPIGDSLLQIIMIIVSKMGYGEGLVFVDKG
jgi:hypothetical protein